MTRQHTKVRTPCSGDLFSRTIPISASLSGTPIMDLKAQADVVTEVESVRKDALSPSGEDRGAAVDESDRRLHELGYKSEFRRDMSLFGVLGISFCAIGILTGMSSAFQTGLFSGGPLGLFWGWNVRPYYVSCRVSR